MTDLSVPARPVDVHALPVMLTAPRLRSFHRHWSTLAEHAAASFLAALAELEISERETRRIRRRLLESRRPSGKTLATFDFAAIPGVPRARVEALAAGDRIETGANLIVIGNSGAGKTHVLRAIGNALDEAARRVLYTRATDLVRDSCRPPVVTSPLRAPSRNLTASISSFSTTSPTPGRIRPRPPSSSSSSPGATRPGASPSPPTRPSAHGTALSLTRPRHRRDHRQARPPCDHPGNEHRQLPPPRRHRPERRDG